MSYGPRASGACTPKTPGVSRFKNVVRTGTTGSTNDDVARILGEERARGLVLVAAYQERGAGRRGRAWIAPAGSALLCTLALPDALPSANLWAVPFWAALVAYAALRELGAEPALQWPNDVLTRSGNKIAGILCISRITGAYAWAGCGIGINVLRPAAADAYAGLEPPPAFLSDLCPVSVDATLDALLAAADANYDLLQQPERIVNLWERAASVPGTRYRILFDNETQPFDAAALALLPDGSLLVDRDGEHVVVTLADARVLR